jgi:hypothetical protein
MFVLVYGKLFGVTASLPPYTERHGLLQKPQQRLIQQRNRTCNTLAFSYSITIHLFHVHVALLCHRFRYFLSTPL